MLGISTDCSHGRNARENIFHWLSLNHMFSWNCYYIQGKPTSFFNFEDKCFVFMIITVNILKLKSSLSYTSYELLFSCEMCLLSWQGLRLFISFIKLSKVMTLDVCEFSIQKRSLFLILIRNLKQRSFHLISVCKTTRAFFAFFVNR